MKVRSPLLGYNHNIRYGGRLYHVQTEDSGINNPHIFTHLFHEGTILASKRANYSATDEDAAVKLVMQAQHKGMLKELREGVFELKIAKFFGDPLPPGADDVSEVSEESVPAAEAAPEPIGLSGQLIADALGLSGDLDFDISLEDEQTAPLQRIDSLEDMTLAELAPFEPSAPPLPLPPAYDEPSYDEAPLPLRTAFDLPPVPRGTPPPMSPPQLRFTPPRVQAVARKQAVIVGRPMVVVGGAPSGRNTPAPGPRPTDNSIFGDEAEVDKSLDEVILAYLSEDGTPKK